MAGTEAERVAELHREADVDYAGAAAWRLPPQAERDELAGIRTLAGEGGEA